MKDQDRQAAKEAVAKLSTKEKIAYYVGYYKIHALVVLILAIAIGLFIRTQLNYQEKIMYFGVLDASSINEDYLIEQVCQQLNATDKETIDVYSGLSTEADYSSEGGYNMLSVYMATDQMDIIFSDEAGVSYLAKSGAAADPAIWAPEEFQSQWQDKIYTCDALEEDVDYDNPTYVTQATAYDISGTKLMENLGLDENCHYMVACYSSGRLEEIQSFCQWILENE